MGMYSTRQAAKTLGLHVATLARYVEQGKVPAPTILKVGSASLHAWTAEDIERVRTLLPKIANGRKTRYAKKKHSAVSTQQSVKAKAKTKTKKKPQPRAAHGVPGSSTVPHVQRATNRKSRS